MHRRCTVCAHQRLAWINEQLRGEQPNLSALGRELRVSRQSLQRHLRTHPLDQVEPILIEEIESELAKRRKRRVRIDDAVAKGEFLGAFKTTGDYAQATTAAGVSRFDVQRWLEHDETFSLRFNQAKAELVEHLEATAVERAVKGGRLVRQVYRSGMLYEEIHEYRPSDAALIKLLSSLKPEVYGDKLQVTQTSIVKAVDADAWNAV